MKCDHDTWHELFDSGIIEAAEIVMKYSNPVQKAVRDNSKYTFNFLELADDLFMEKREHQSQVLVGVRSSVCESLTLTRATKMIILKLLTIPAHEEENHARVRRKSQTKETKIWSLSGTDELDVFSNTHLNKITDVRKIVVKKRKIWNVKIEEEADTENEKTARFKKRTRQLVWKDSSESRLEVSAEWHTARTYHDAKLLQ